MRISIKNKSALIEMPGSLECGKIIKQSLIFPHSNNPLEKSSNGCLTFPHYNKAFIKENIFLNKSKKTIRFAHTKKQTIPSTFFSFTCGSFFCKMSGRNKSESVDGIIGIRSDTVGLDPTSFMHHFRHVPGIRREKYRNRFIYFSNDTDIYTRQREKRILLTQESKKSISDADAVVLLVEFIKHPDISIEGLSKKVSEKGVMVVSEIIKRFLEYHDLVEKKTDIKQ